MHKDLRILLLSDYLNVFGYGIFGPLYAIFVLQAGGSSFHAGAIWSVYAFVAGLLMFILGKIEDSRRDHRQMIVLGYFLLAFGALAFLLVQDVLHLYLVQVFNAIGVGILTPAWKAVYAKQEDKGEESEEWAFFDGGNLILTAVAAFIGGVVVSKFGFPPLFISMFVIQIAAAFYSIRLLKRLDHPPSNVPRNEKP